MHLAMENDKINKKKLYFKTSSARWYMTIYRPSEPSFFAGVDNYASHLIKYARNVYELYLMYYLETSKHGDKSIKQHFMLNDNHVGVDI